MPCASVSARSAICSAADPVPVTASDDVYDLKGLHCPLPVLKTRRRLSDLPAGGLLWVETTDPLAAIDIPAFCAENGHRLVESVSVTGGHRFLIERG